MGHAEAEVNLLSHSLFRLGLPRSMNLPLFFPCPRLWLDSLSATGVPASLNPPNLPIEATLLENCNVVGGISYRGDVAWGP